MKSPDPEKVAETGSDFFHSVVIEERGVEDKP